MSWRRHILDIKIVVQTHLSHLLYAAPPLSARDQQSIQGTCIHTSRLYLFIWFEEIRLLRKFKMLECFMVSCTH